MKILKYPGNVGTGALFGKWYLRQWVADTNVLFEVIWFDERMINISGIFNRRDVTSLIIPSKFPGNWLFIETKPSNFSSKCLKLDFPLLLPYMSSSYTIPVAHNINMSTYQFFHLWNFSFRCKKGTKQNKAKKQIPTVTSGY